MRSIFVSTLFIAGLAPSLWACGPYGDLTPDTIKFPGVARYSFLRGDHLLCLNDANRLIAVDLKRGKSFDLGSAAGKYWYDGDVADGRALLIEKDRLLVLSLNDGKAIHDIAIGAEPASAYGFAAKDQAFIHRGRSLAIVELSTGKTLHNIELGEGAWFRAAWQKVGNRLYIGGPATTLCVIDLQAGKLLDRISVDARAGIDSLHVEGTTVYCIGTPFGWGARIDHLVSVDLETKRCRHVDLPRQFRSQGRFAGGPYGTAYLIEGDRCERFTMAGERCATFTMPGQESIIGVWNQRALVARVNEIRLEEMKETPVARK